MNTDRIKALAKEQGKSITYLCSLLNRPKYYLNDIKKNDSEMPEEYLKTIANELNTTVAYLKGETDNPPPFLILTRSKNICPMRKEVCVLLSAWPLLG